MRRLYLDFETHPIKPGLAAPKPVAYGYAIDGGDVRIERAQDNAVLFTELGRADEIVGHNVAFDLGVACAEWPKLVPLVFDEYEAGRIRDTMVIQALIDSALGEFDFRRSPGGAVAKASRSLDALVAHHLRRELPKEGTFRLKYGLLDGTPVSEWPPEAREYLVRDVEATRDVYGAQLALVQSEAWERETLCKPGTLPDLERQHRASWWLWLMGAWGVRIDGPRLAALRHDMETQIAALEKQLETAGLMAGGTKKMEPCRERVAAWYAARGMNAPTTDGGKVSTSADVVDATDDPALRAWSEHTHLQKIVGTYLDAMAPGVSAPICARWNVLVDSGRTSGSQPNFQNPPRKGGVRECVVPRENRVFVFADYDTAELRALAQILLDLFKASALADALRAGKDPHLLLAAQLLGMTYEEAYAQRKTERVAGARQFSKAANLGFPGGLGAETFVDYARGYGFDMTIEQSRDLRDTWFRTFPEMQKYFEHVSGVLEATGVIKHHRSGRVRGGCTFTSAANSFFQGMVADGAKEAGWRISRECYSAGNVLSGARPILFLHDEFCVEVEEARAYASARRIQEHMIAGMAKFIPDVPITCSPAIHRRWYKGGEAVIVNGLMVPSRPEKRGDETIWVPDLLGPSSSEIGSDIHSPTEARI